MSKHSKRRVSFEVHFEVTSDKLYDVYLALPKVVSHLLLAFKVEKHRYLFSECQHDLLPSGHCIEIYCSNWRGRHHVQ